MKQSDERPPGSTFPWDSYRRQALHTWVFDGGLEGTHFSKGLTSPSLKLQKSLSQSLKMQPCWSSGDLTSFPHVWHVQDCLRVYYVHVCVINVCFCMCTMWNIQVCGVCECAHECSCTHVWYMHICDVYMYVSMYIPVHGRVDARGWCLPLPCPVYFLNMVCHWSWNWSFLSCWLASKSPGMPVSITPVLGFWMDTTTSWLFTVDASSLHSGPPTCTASLLPT